MNEWKKLQSTLQLFGILASIFIISLTIYTFKSMGYIGSAPATNTISVTGHGESFAVPNIATVSFSVEKTAKTVADAQNQVTTVMNDVLATLKTSGVADKDVQTISYDVNPKYDYQSSVCTANGICPPSRQILTGYTVTDSVQVKIRAIDTAGNIIGVLGQKNVTNISGLTLSVEDDSAVKTEARNKAIAQAKAQAESIAKGLGVQLVRITSFSESGSARPIFYSKDMVLGTGASAPTPSIPVGQNTSSSDVSITYEIQ
jgi:uncharacterized protein YggE